MRGLFTAALLFRQINSRLKPHPKSIVLLANSASRADGFNELHAIAEGVAKFEAIISRNRDAGENLDAGGGQLFPPARKIANFVRDVGLGQARRSWMSSSTPT